MSNYWKDHGTKILGAITTALGAISAASPDTLSGIFGPKGPAIAVTAAGLLTIVRGFTNSTNNNGASK